jgi:hypothetical protein
LAFSGFSFSFLTALDRGLLRRAAQNRDIDGDRAQGCAAYRGGWYDRLGRDSLAQAHVRPSFVERRFDQRRGLGDDQRERRVGHDAARCAPGLAASTSGGIPSLPSPRRRKEMHSRARLDLPLAQSLALPRSRVVCGLWRISRQLAALAPSLWLSQRFLGCWG